jgi:adenylate cyclase
MTKLRNWWRRYRVPVTPGIAIILLVAVLQSVKIPIVSPITDRVGLLAFDSFQRISPREYRDAPVRILDIDDETIARYGQWPWPRTDMARLTQALGNAGAAAIAFDIVFSEADRTSPHALARRFADTDPAVAALLNGMPDNDAQFATILGATPSVMGFFLTGDKKAVTIEPKAGMISLGSPPTSVMGFTSAISPLPALYAAAPGAGSVSIVPDSDSVIRRAPLIARQGETILPSLSLDALRIALGTDSVLIKTSDGSEEGSAPGDVVSLKIGDTEIPTNEAGELWLHYSRAVPERIVPAWRLMSGDLSAAEKKRFFEGNIVFIGTSAIGLRDLRSTPLNDTELGVMVHAQAAEQIIQQDFLTRPDWAVGLERLMLLVLGLALVFTLPMLGALWGALIGGTAVVVMGAGSWLAFEHYGYLLNPTWPIIGISLAYLAVTSLTFYREEKQRAHIHSAFDRYLAPELVRRIANDPGKIKLGGEERDMTVLFCDVRSFSTISEKMSPDEIIRFLIKLLTPLTDILIEHRSTIDKYIGDAIVAFWNAPLDDPNQYENAACGALAMQAALGHLNQHPEARSDVNWPGVVKVGIGLNAGPCCVGNMGSEQRLSYSLIGDTVNLAARIEGQTKYYGVDIAIGSSLNQAIPGFATIELDRVRVVGRSQPETIYALLGAEEVAASADYQAFKSGHEAMLTAYREWDIADAQLAAHLDLAGHFGLAKLYALYADRIAAFRSDDPGSAWDGVFDATNK